MKMQIFFYMSAFHWQTAGMKRNSNIQCRFFFGRVQEGLSFFKKKGPPAIHSHYFLVSREFLKTTKR